MKITEFRVLLKTTLTDATEADALSDALARFDDMSIFEFASFLNARKITGKSSSGQKATSKKPSVDLVTLANTLRMLKTKPDQFDAEMDKIASTKSISKAAVQRLYDELFENKSPLPASLTKPEMIERIKRQRRRDANFASA